MNAANTRTERTAFAASLVLHVAFAIAVVAKLPARVPDTPASALRILLASNPEPTRAAVREESRAMSPVTRAPVPARPLARVPAATPASGAPAIRAVETSTPASASDARTSGPATPASGAPPAAPEPAPAPAQPSAPVFDAAYLENPAPPYPRAARRGGIEGRVVLRVLVNPSGAADEVLVRNSSGHDSLDEAARTTVARWRFVPARLGERAVAAWVLVPVSFHLDS